MRAKKCPAKLSHWVMAFGMLHPFICRILPARFVFLMMAKHYTQLWRGSPEAQRVALVQGLGPARANTCPQPLLQSPPPSPECVDRGPIQFVIPLSRFQLLRGAAMPSRIRGDPRPRTPAGDASRSPRWQGKSQASKKRDERN